MPSNANSAQQAPKPDVVKACREALLELQEKREIEANLKEQVATLKRQGALKDDRIESYKVIVKEYEAAIEERKTAEKIVEQLRQNYEAQLKEAQKQINAANRRATFWQWAAAVALVAGFIFGQRR